MENDLMVISAPNNDNKLVLDGDPSRKYGLCQNRGQFTDNKKGLTDNDYQEDTLVVHMPNTNPYLNFTPQEIGDCLKKSLDKLDQKAPKSSKNPNEPVGSTVSTTIWTGTHLVTATLGDAVAFIAVYGNDNEVIGVTRLNSVIHSPDDKNEQKRIRAIDKSVIYPAGRMKKSVKLDDGYSEDTQSIAVTRAIGDNVPFWQKDNGESIISAEAQIDTTTCEKVLDSINRVRATKKINKVDYSKDLKFQVITTCDGFTERTDKSKEDHENYLLEKLKAIYKPGNLDEVKLAEDLANEALKDGSTDNVSVAVMTLDPNKPFLVGVFDGHGGNQVSHYLAHQFCPTFYATCFIEHVKKFLKVTPVTPDQLSQINDQLDKISNVASSPKTQGDEQVEEIIENVSKKLEKFKSPESQSSQTWVQTLKNLADLILGCLGLKTFKDSDKEIREARFAEIKTLHEIVKQHHQESPKEGGDENGERGSFIQGPKQI